MCMKDTCTCSYHIYRDFYRFTIRMFLLNSNQLLCFDVIQIMLCLLYRWILHIQKSLRFTANAVFLKAASILFTKVFSTLTCDKHIYLGISIWRRRVKRNIFFNDIGYIHSCFSLFLSRYENAI